MTTQVPAKTKQKLQIPFFSSSSFVSSCTNTYLKERAKGYPFLTKILPNTGGWYVLGTWNSTTWNMQDAMEKVHVDYWTNALFTFRVATDW
jgi:hypothetical protein